MTTFQSRFGPEEWLQPYTDKMIEKLAKDNIEHLQIVAPGFSADCLETIEELDVKIEKFLKSMVVKSLVIFLV